MNHYVAIAVILILGVFCYLIIGEVGQAGELEMQNLTTNTVEQKTP